MTRLLLLTVALALQCRGADPPRQILPYEPVGDLTVVRPAGTAVGVAILVSGDAGFDATMQAMADVLASAGAVVVGVDLPQYRSRIAAASGDEVYPAADFEVLSQFSQRALGMPAYALPVLVGWQAGAAVVYAALAEANPDTYRGAVSIDFCPVLTIPKPPGRLRGLLATRIGPDSYRLLPSPRLHGRWIVVQPETPQACPGDVRAFVQGVDHAKLIAGRGDGMAALGAAFRSLAGVVPSEDRAPAAADVSGLPLVEVPATGGRRDTIAVIVSGDGGWASIDRDIGRQLAARGIGVIGLNSLRYFWTRRTPDGAAADLARIVRHYVAAWHARRVLLVGYSRGADVLPFMVNRLPPDVRSHVALVALLGPGPSVDFQFHLSDWIANADRATALPVRPEVERLRGMRLLCVYGEDESDSICPGLEPGLAALLRQPGGHHFGGDYDAIVTRILALGGVVER
jgi:type IV secretory pathway VirJ component